jgi:hypothetical protein
MLFVHSKGKNFQSANPGLGQSLEGTAPGFGAPEAVPSSGVRTSPPRSPFPPKPIAPVRPCSDTDEGNLEPGDAPFAAPGIMPPASCGGNSGESVGVLFFVSF